MKPILFNGDMVRAILDGRKACTRRPIKDACLQGMTETGELFGGLNEPPYKLPNDFRTIRGSKWVYPKWGYRVQTHVDADRVELLFCPYEIGDILYVGETFGKDKHGHYHYRADYPIHDCEPYPIWKPSIHMPREAARIFLKVTGVRVERLQEITESVAVSEGCEYDWNGDDYRVFYGNSYGVSVNTSRAKFLRVWERVYSKRGYGWEQNPWVWVIEFERAKGVAI